MKRIVRLTESDLHKIVKESVNRVLREAAYDINSTEYKQMYDSGDKWYDGREDADTRKEIENYEALPDKVRHPFGTEIPDLQDRIKNRSWNSNDKLAQKEPNSILKKQQEKRDFQRDLESSKKDKSFKQWAKIKKGIDIEQLNNKEKVDLYRNWIWEYEWYLADQESKNSWRDWEDY